MAHIWINIKSEMFSLMFHTGYEGKKTLQKKHLLTSFMQAPQKSFYCLNIHLVQIMQSYSSKILLFHVLIAIFSLHFRYGLRNHTLSKCRIQSK